MPLYRYQSTPWSRARGRNAVAAAAYRAGVRLFDERHRRHHDFRARAGVAYREILLPPSAPLVLRERAVLWNAAERAETRRNARVARELLVALPRELSLNEQLILVRSFLARLVAQRQIAVDFAIHVDRAHAPHAHALCTVRAIDGQGFGAKDRHGDARAQLQADREAWAQAINAALERAAVVARVDHRSRAAQGLRGPGVSLSRRALILERRGVATAVGIRAVHGYRAQIRPGDPRRGAPRGSLRAHLGIAPAPVPSRGRARAMGSARWTRAWPWVIEGRVLRSEPGHVIVRTKSGLARLPTPRALWPGAIVRLTRLWMHRRGGRLVTYRAERALRDRARSRA